MKISNEMVLIGAAVLVGIVLMSRRKAAAPAQPVAGAGIWGTRLADSVLNGAGAASAGGGFGVFGY